MFGTVFIQRVTIILIVIVVNKEMMQTSKNLSKNLFCRRALADCVVCSFVLFIIGMYGLYITVH